MSTFSHGTQEVWFCFSWGLEGTLWLQKRILTLAKFESLLNLHVFSGGLPWSRVDLSGSFCVLILHLTIKPHQVLRILEWSMATVWCWTDRLTVFCQEALEITSFSLCPIIPFLNKISSKETHTKKRTLRRSHILLLTSLGHKCCWNSWKALPYRRLLSPQWGCTNLKPKQSHGFLHSPRSVRSLLHWTRG